jgi:DNA adenine methylase
MTRSKDEYANGDWNWPIRGATVLLANRDNGDGFFEKILGGRGTFHYFDVTYTAGRRKKNDTRYEAKAAREFLAIIK